MSMNRNVVWLLVWMSMITWDVIPTAEAAHIIWVSESRDTANPPELNDHGWTDLLTGAGHTVERRTILGLDTNDVAFVDLNAADLVMISRDHSTGALSSNPIEKDRWNCVKTPLILMNGAEARAHRWGWVSGVNNLSATGETEVLQPQHAIFEGAPLGPADTILIHEANTAVPDAWGEANGMLLAVDSALAGAPWVGHWAAGVEFFTNSGAYAGGPRLFFAGGNRVSPRGAENFNLAGERIFLNAVDFMLAEPRVKITFSGYRGHETLTDIPLLISLSTNVPGFDYSGFVRDDGYDLRVWNSNRTEQLPFEIDGWDTDGTSMVWVKVPELKGSNTCIFLSWGNVAHSNQPVWSTNGTVWSAGYEGVWHLRQPDIRDSTSNRHHGIASGTVLPTAGRIGAGLQFGNGPADFMTLAGYAGITGALDRTVSLWTRTDDTDGAFVAWGESRTGNRWTFRINDGESGTSGAARVEVFGGIAVHDRIVRDNTWHHAVV
ncbi:MAG: DUF2341 domain-containing protein, partial [Verrucomicrobiota bacterium]